MKRVISILLLVVIICTLAGCSGRMYEYRRYYDEANSTVHYHVTCKPGYISKITEAELPSKKGGDPVLFVGPAAFRDAVNLKQVIVPEGITTIMQFAFANCESLTTVELPNSLTSIYQNAFEGCVSLTQLELPEGITYIGDDAFKNCTSLNKINLPTSLKGLGNAFEGCKQLDQIHYNGTVEQWIALEIPDENLGKRDVVCINGIYTPSENND